MTDQQNGKEKGSSGLLGILTNKLTIFGTFLGALVLILNAVVGLEEIVDKIFPRKS